MEKDVNKDDVRASGLTSVKERMILALMPKCNGFDLPMSLDLIKLADLLENEIAEYADQQTAALRKEVEFLHKEMKGRSDALHKQLSELAETNKRLEGHMDSYILENAKLESELTTLRSEKGLANVLPTDGEIEKLLRWTISQWASINEKNEPDHQLLVDRWIANDVREWMRDRLQNQSPEKSPPARQQ